MSASLHDRARPAVEGTHRDVDPAQVWEHRGAVVLIDVREPGEYTGELGHVPGATLVPLSSEVGLAALMVRARMRDG